MPPDAWADLEPAGEENRPIGHALIAPGIDALIGMDYLSNLRLTVWGGNCRVSPQ